MGILHSDHLFSAMLFFSTLFLICILSINLVESTPVLRNLQNQTKKGNVTDAEVAKAVEAEVTEAAAEIAEAEKEVKEEVAQAEAEIEKEIGDAVDQSAAEAVVEEVVTEAVAEGVEAEIVGEEVEKAVEEAVDTGLIEPEEAIVLEDTLHNMTTTMTTTLHLLSQQHLQPNLGHLFLEYLNKVLSQLRSLVLLYLL